MNYLTEGIYAKKSVPCVDKKISLRVQMWQGEYTSESVHSSLYQKDFILSIRQIMENLIHYDDCEMRQYDLLRFLNKGTFSLIKSSHILYDNGQLSECWLLIKKEVNDTITIPESNVLSFLAYLGPLPLYRAYSLRKRKSRMAFQKFEDTNRGTYIKDVSWRTKIGPEFFYDDILEEVSETESFSYDVRFKEGMHITSPCSGIKPIDFGGEKFILQLDQICSKKSRF